MAKKNLNTDSFWKEYSKEDEEKFAQKMEKITSTQGSQKLLNYFKELSQTIPFQNQIKTWREKYDIPTNGFNPAEGQVFPPEKWEHRHTDIHRKLGEEIRKLCKKYSLHFLYWGDHIKSLLFYNNFFKIFDYGFDVCLFINLQEEAEEPFTKDIQDADNFAFPLAIRISPYASERDIIDFIKKNYSLGIKLAQNQYIEKNINIGKIKNKKISIKERNDFIYKNKHLPRKELATLVSKEFKEFLDYGHIAKIISLERKRRKEV